MSLHGVTRPQWVNIGKNCIGSHTLIEYLNLHLFYHHISLATLMNNTLQFDIKTIGTPFYPTHHRCPSSGKLDLLRLLVRNITMQDFPWLFKVHPNYLPPRNWSYFQPLSIPLPWLIGVKIRDILKCPYALHYMIYNTVISIKCWIIVHQTNFLEYKGQLS